MIASQLIQAWLSFNPNSFVRLDQVDQQREQLAGSMIDTGRDPLAPSITLGRYGIESLAPGDVYQSPLPNRLAKSTTSVRDSESSLSQAESSSRRSFGNNRGTGGKETPCFTVFSSEFWGL